MDIIRSIPEFKAFQVETKHNKVIKHLMYAFVVQNPAIGYTQSMTYLAILVYFYLKEAMAFRLICNLVLNSTFLQNFYLIRVEQISAYYSVFMSLLQRLNKSLHSHFVEEGLTPDLFLLDWFMTFYFKIFDIQDTAYIFDRFLLQGYSIIFRVALAILHLNARLFKSLPFETLYLTIKGKNYDHSWP